MASSMTIKHSIYFYQCPFSSLSFLPLSSPPSILTSFLSFSLVCSTGQVRRDMREMYEKMGERLHSQYISSQQCLEDTRQKLKSQAMQITKVTKDLETKVWGGRKGGSERERLSKGEWEGGREREREGERTKKEGGMNKKRREVGGNRDTNNQIPPQWLYCLLFCKPVSLDILSSHKMRLPLFCCWCDRRSVLFGPLSIIIIPSIDFQY